MPSLVAIGPQMKQGGGGANVLPPAYMVPKHPSLNRVNSVLFTASLSTGLCGMMTVKSKTK